jgi:hypothetical protein
VGQLVGRGFGSSRYNQPGFGRSGQMGFARIVSVLALAAALQAPDAPAIARGGSEEFAQGKFAELIMRFDAQMKAAATEMLLRQTLMQLTGQVGAFEKVDGSTDCKDAGTVTLCITPLLFERRRILLRIAVNGEGQIAGLTIAGSQPRGGAGGTPPAASVAPPDRNIDVVTGNITMPGVLRLPDGPGPHPLIVLVHGSGAHDADETIGPNKPFRDLAEGLARQGVATLRYVKRNRGNAIELSRSPRRPPSTRSP